MAYFTIAVFILIALFHVYMGLGGKMNYQYVLPTMKGKPLPFHSLAALPVAFLLAISAIAFAHEANITGPLMYSALLEKYLWLTGIALISRGLGGLIFFHALNMMIDRGHFKTWDLRLYSPLTIYLGIHCLIVLN